jgi:hypothetical protein
MEEFLKDSGSFVIRNKTDWNCLFCGDSWSDELGNAKSSRVPSCKSRNHIEELQDWLSKSTQSGERVEYSGLLDTRVLHLDLESDKREIKSMMFDFVRETGVATNSFVKILDRLRALEHKNVKLVLALAVLKSFAEVESNDEPIRREAKKLKTMRSVQDLVTSRRESWKKYMSSVSASGKAQLVVQLVERFIHRPAGIVIADNRSDADARSDAEDSE